MALLTLGFLYSIKSKIEDVEGRPTCFGNYLFRGSFLWERFRMKMGK